MDMESRRAATIVALAQMGATFSAYLVVLFVSSLIQKSDHYVPEDLAFLRSNGLILLAIPLGWICLVMRLQARGRDLLLGMVFYGGIAYVIGLMISAALVFGRLARS